MGQNFEALAVARQQCEPERRRFEMMVLRASVAIVLVTAVVVLLQQVSAATWHSMHEVMIGYCRAFVEHGLGMHMAVGLLLAVALYRDFLLVKSLRKFHEDSPDAQTSDTERWLMQRRGTLWKAALVYAMPFVISAVILKGAALLVLLVPLVFVMSKLLGQIYAPLRSTAAVRGNMEERIRQARNSGYMHARFTDYDVPPHYIANFEDGAIREAYIEGLQHGKQMRSKLRRRGIDVDYKGG